MRFWILGWIMQLLPLILLVGEVTAFATVVSSRRSITVRRQQQLVRFAAEKDYDDITVADNRGEESVDERERKLLEREVVLLKRENELLLTQHQQQQEQSASPLDLDREVFKMQSFESYVLVSALVSTCTLSSLVFFQPIDDPSMDLTFPNNILCLITQLTAVVGTMASLLSTIVFSLEELYGKSALGLKRDAIYREFLSNTSDSRILGFRAFSLSLLTFAVHAGLVAVERIRGLPSKFITGAFAAIGIYYIFVNYAKITNAASAIYKENDDNSSIDDGSDSLVVVGGDDGVDGSSSRDDTKGDSLEGTEIRMAQRNRRRSL